MVALIRTRITYRGAFAAMFEGRREWNRQIEQPSWKAVGLAHKRRHLPKHFTEQAQTEYEEYRPRKGELMARGSKAWRRSYVGRKFKKLGHTLPLVYSGELRNRALRPEIRPTSKGVRVVIPGTQKANLRHPKSHVLMAHELRAVSRPEARLLAATKAKAMGRAIRAVRATRTKYL